MEDFFISYNKADRSWAMGIGDWLDQAGFTAILQEQDFVAGSNFVSEMHRAVQSAKRLVMVLSPDYLQAKFPEAEWTATFSSDPTGERRTVIPVRVRECHPAGLLRPIVYIDLVGLSADDARKKLLEEIGGALRGKQRGRRAVAEQPATSSEGARQPAVNQTVTGDRNVVVGGNFVMY
jgi:TIR domain